MTVRLFDELDTQPEPAELPFCGGTTNMGDIPKCYGCQQTIQDGVHHIDPETGDYDCTN